MWKYLWILVLSMHSLQSHSYEYMCNLDSPIGPQIYEIDLKKKSVTHTFNLHLNARPPKYFPGWGPHKVLEWVGNPPSTIITYLNGQLTLWDLQRGRNIVSFIRVEKYEKRSKIYDETKKQWQNGFDTSGEYGVTGSRTEYCIKK